MTNDPYARARQLRDAAMKRAIEHADRVNAGWSEAAYECLCAHAKLFEEFTTEEVRWAAYAQGLPEPPDDRSWGVIPRRAVKEGVISFVRFEPSRNPTGHMRPVHVWRSNIFQQKRAA